MLQITIETDNAAFDDDCAAEVARILHEFAAKIEAGNARERGQFIDINGNSCGLWDWVVTERRDQDA